MVNKTTISNFLDNELVDFASYSTLRAIASYIDGLKNAHRKVVYYMQSTSNKEKKVFNLSGEIMTSTEYLHGDISGSIITLAQDFIGSNNLPLLKREGNFGSRFTPEASAIRYIYTLKENYFNLIFNPEDNPILISQEFEGSKIEPRFFVPTIPLLVVNGSEGIATGFAQKILPRNPKEVIKYIKNKLNDNKTLNLIPYYKNFKGNIKKGENNQWIIEGVFKRIAKNKIKITEIPIGYNLKTYTKILDSLEDKNIIKSYIDKSEEDTFDFEVKFDMQFLSKNSDFQILEKMKLIKKVTENYTCINENNRVQEFKNIYEIIDSYIKVKLEYTKKRKEYKINLYSKEIFDLEDKIKFIKAVIDNKLVINKQKYDNIIDNAKKLDIQKPEIHIKMSVQSLTFEKIKELNIEIKSKKSELQELKKLSERDIWLQDLESLKI